VGVTSSPALWTATRASGIVAYVLLTLVAVIGLALSGRLRLETWPRFALEEVHRFGGLLVGVFVWLHVLTVALDSYVPFSLAHLVVPFTSSYRPFWTGMGIVAAELLLALALTNALRKRLPYRFWRAAHALNAVVWAAATVHGIWGGSDGGRPWLVGLYAGSVCAVALSYAAARSSSTSAKQTPSTQLPSRQ
jgi:sulfoxide reductase heme-binding subunit YedZ